MIPLATRNAAGDRAGHAGDATEVGEGEEDQRLAVVELVRRDVAEPVGHDRAADAGDERRHGEGEHLGAGRR